MSVQRPSQRSVGASLDVCFGGLCAYRLALVRRLSRPLPPFGQLLLSAQLRSIRSRSAMSSLRRFETSLKRLKCKNSGQSLATRRACQIDPRRNFRPHRACGRLRRQAETTNRGYHWCSPKVCTMTKEKVDSRPKTSGKRRCRREGLKLGAMSMVRSLRAAFRLRCDIS